MQLSPRLGRSPKVLSRRPSRLRPRIALTLTGDARAKAGGAIPLVEPELSLAFPRALQKFRFSFIVRRREQNASVTASAKYMTATRYALSGDSNSDPPPTCTNPHSQHAFMLSVFGALSCLFFRFPFRLARGFLEVGIRQSRSDQAAFPLFT